MEEHKMSFHVTPGVAASLANKNDNRAYYTFNGDLNQLGQIYLFLIQQGFNVVKSDVYPGFPKDKEADYIEALKLIHDQEIEGWWDEKHQRDYIKYGICTKEEFTRKFDRSRKTDSENHLSDHTRNLDL